MNNVALWAPTLTKLTPRRANMLVAQLSPALCQALERWARGTLVASQRQGRSDAARLCIVMLDALRSAEARHLHHEDDLPPLAA